MGKSVCAKSGVLFHAGIGGDRKYQGYHCGFRIGAQSRAVSPVSVTGGLDMKGVCCVRESDRERYRIFRVFVHWRSRNNNSHEQRVSNLILICKRVEIGLQTVPSGIDEQSSVQQDEQVRAGS